MVNLHGAGHNVAAAHTACYALAPRVGGIKRWRASDVCLSVVSGPSREQRGLGRLKLAQIEVAHVTCDSDTTFKVKRSTCRRRWHCGGLPHSFFLVCILYITRVQNCSKLGAKWPNVCRLCLKIGKFWVFCRQLQVVGGRSLKNIHTLQWKITAYYLNGKSNKISPVGDWRSTSHEWPWPWFRPYGIPSCITHRPLPTYQISSRSEEKIFRRSPLRFWSSSESRDKN